MMGATGTHHHMNIGSSLAGPLRMAKLNYRDTEDTERTGTELSPSRRKASTQARDDDNDSFSENSVALW
jgi:hypothetical protein